MFDRLRRTFKSMVDSVTEAIATSTLSEGKVREICDELFIQLVESDVAVEVAEAVVKAVGDSLLQLKVPRFTGKEEAVRNGVMDALLGLLRDVADVDFMGVIRGVGTRPVVLLFLGPNGYGKTTTMAKIARLLMRNDYSVVWAAADTFRAGAIEQLEAHAKKLGIRVIKHGYGADPAAVAFDAVSHAKSHGIDVVMVDTAGRMHTDTNLMNELGKIQRVTRPQISVFIADALLGNEALEIARTYVRHVNVDGLVVTKVDAYPKGGSILTFLYALRKPIYFLGTGQGYDDLKPFNKVEFIRQILSP
jgi:fused signal recognition particle receptor